MNIPKFFNCHNHTEYSNIRLLDCINKPEQLINKAIELGLSGIAITDHECLSAHMEVNLYSEKIAKEYPDFKIALGNEIYLTDSRDKNQNYYHFILIAKDKIGHKALRELSSIAWYKSYYDRRMERVPTLKSELKSIVAKYPGHLIATTACLGGELSSKLLKLINAEKVHDENYALKLHNEIIGFMLFCKDLFDDDFYVECAPSTTRDQIEVNKRLYSVAKAFKVKIIPATDSHYLTKEDRFVHKAYLNSKGGEREVDSFYEYARLMDAQEVFELLNYAFEDEAIAYEIIENTQEIYNKIEPYSLKKNQQIPQVEIPFSYNFETLPDYITKPTLKKINNGNRQEKYWLSECIKGLKRINKFEDEEYWDRIETEADVIDYIGNKLETCLFSYFNTFQHYIDLFWECGSIVGPGRGSATGFLSNYLLGITQLDPIKWKLPWWRFLNKERAELPDIDIDLAPSKRPLIFEKIRKERGELGLVQVATFGTEGTKSTILTACRGYRSEEFPDGIDVDTAQYMSSLVPSHRGFLWPLKDVVYGNPKEDRKPIQAFINAVNQYDGLLNIMFSIEGIVNKRSSHASGVILYDEDPYETAAFMRTPKGALITAYDLHNAEAAGDTKYDFLVTEISDKIIKEIELLQKDNVIEQDSLRNIYNKYLHPEIMDTTDSRIWESLASGNVMDVFQFNSGAGLAIAKKVKPQNPIEMTAANAMMRLMSEKGKESQQDRFVRIKTKGIKTFDDEMKAVHLPQEMISSMHKYCDEYFGCVPIQEQMMQILMDKNIGRFTLAEANDARKIVAKKQMSRIPELKEKVFNNINNKEWAQYIWEVAIAPQLGYAFSLNHSLPYSFVGIQTIYLAIRFNPIYWDTACLIVNSGATDEDSGSSTDYKKIAKAIGDVKEKGIKVSLVDINNSDFGFSPDVKNNQILFGLKGMLNVGDDVIANTIANRPYVSPRDFLNKVKPGKQAMISLIKGGAFDEMMDRKLCMGWYLWETCDKKKRITLQNMGGLIKYGIIPTKNEELVTAKRVFEFNRYLKAMCKSTDPKTYYLDERGLSFIMELGYEGLLTVVWDNYMLNVAEWEKKVYQPWMDKVRNWIASDKDGILQALNTQIFLEDWNKYALGNLSSWEMEALCFYYHEHELINVNKDRYGIVDFFNLPETPEIDYTFRRGGRDIPIFKLHKICGTCVAKDKNKGTVSLLTTTGVVEVKFRKEYFSLFDKQISEKQPDGKSKKIIEKSWFNRGSMIMVQGIRDGDTFITKKYSSSPSHQLYKIDKILENGELLLRYERYQGEDSIYEDE